MSSDLIRVVLADDHAVVRSGLRAVLGAAPDITVVGEAINGEQAVALVDRHHPDVVILDLDMAGMNGLAATKAIAPKENAPKILILTMHTEEEYLVPLLQAGAAGYLVKSAADRELVDAVRTVARGEMFVQANAARVLARRVTKKDPEAEERARFDKLTERERNVLVMVAQGYTAPEIGEKLYISPKTVDTYKQRINEKLALTHRADYVKMALRLGLLSAT